MDEGTIRESKQMAEHFNSHFHSLGSKLASRVKVNEVCRIKTQHNQTTSLLESPQISKEIVLKLKKNQTPVLDNSTTKH